MKITINGEEKYYDQYLVNAFELIKEAVARKWDGLFYVGGYEGDGKSEFAAQMAYYFDPTYCLDRCVFTPQQFIEAVDKAQPKQAIVYDEAQDVMESTAKDKTAQEIKSLMTRIRKKQLFIIIVAPDFWRINKYLFIHRARAFLRIYSRGLDRGFFEYYNREKKHELKIKGQRYEQLVVKPNFRGRFTHWFPLDQEEYEAKKDAATRKIGGLSVKENEYKEKFEELKWRIIEDEELKAADKSRLTGYSKGHLRALRRARREQAETESGDHTNLTYKESVS